MTTDKGTQTYTERRDRLVRECYAIGCALLLGTIAYAAGAVILHARTGHWDVKKQWQHSERIKQESYRRASLYDELITLTDTNTDGVVSTVEQADAWRRLLYISVDAPGVTRIPKPTLSDLEEAIADYKTEKNR